MQKIELDYSHALPFIEEDGLKNIRKEIISATAMLEAQTGAGNEFLGWLDLPEAYDVVEFARIKMAAQKIQEQSEILIVIGIGGSYLGAKSAIEFLTHSFYNNLPSEQRATPEIHFAGTNLSGTYLTHLIELIGDRDFSINMISKSGTTTEPAIAFRILKKKLIEKYGEAEAKNRIYATTDRERGALKKLSNQEGYETFVVPDNVGGRFSVLTAVGLLPIAVAGIDIDELMQGAYRGMKDARQPFEKNPCLQYVAVRNLLYRNGKYIEMLINYEPRLQYIAEWWKQLYGESEGKNGKGIFPASANFTADLHSLGQYIQDGHRHLFETLIQIEKPDLDITIEADEQDLDGLNYLAGKTLDFVNKKAAEGTLMAHVDGGVPNIIITLPEATPHYLGALFYFFEKACAVSGYMIEVNPFDQPGVEAYKSNMFRLLGKK